jgi:hypothetical protein
VVSGLGLIKIQDDLLNLCSFYLSLFWIITKNTVEKFIPQKIKLITQDSDEDFFDA